MFDWLLNRRGKKKPEPQIPPMTEQERALLAECEALAASLPRPGLRGTVIEDKVPGLLETRLGGPTLSPKGTGVPFDDAGEPLAQLMWVDLKALPEGVDLPRQGWLQVLIGMEYCWGCKFPSRQGQGCRVLHHPPETEFDAHLVDWGDDCPPFMREELAVRGCAIDWQPVINPPSPSHYALSTKLYGEYTQRSLAFDQAMDGFFDKLAIARGRYDVMLLGHGDSTQDDIRTDKRTFLPEERWESLISFSSSGKAMMWGDVGEAVFMLPEADISPMRLGRIAYSWDCC